MSSYPPHLVHFLFMNEIYVLQGQITWRSKSLGSHHLKEKFSFPMLALCLPKRSWSSCSIIIWLFFEPDLAKFLEPLLDTFREAVLATPVPTGATGATAAGKTGGGKGRTAGRDVRLATVVVILLLGFATFAAFGAFLGAAFLATFFCFGSSGLGAVLLILSLRSALVTQSFPSSIVFSMEEDLVSLGVRGLDIFFAISIYLLLQILFMQRLKMQF